MIFVNKEIFSESISALKTESDTLASVTNTFNNIASDVQEEWKGRSGEIFEAFNKDIAIEMKRINSSLEELTSDLNTILEEFESVDNEIAESIVQTN